MFFPCIQTRGLENLPNRIWIWIVKMFRMRPDSDPCNWDIIHNNDDYFHVGHEPVPKNQKASHCPGQHTAPSEDHQEQTTSNRSFSNEACFFLKYLAYIQEKKVPLANWYHRSWPTLRTCFTCFLILHRFKLGCAVIFGLKRIWREYFFASKRMKPVLFTCLHWS